MQSLPHSTALYRTIVTDTARRFHAHIPSSFWPSRVDRCRPSFSPVLGVNFHRAQDSAISLLVRFSSNVSNSRSRAFRESICAQENVLANLHEYARGGIRTYDTDLHQASG